DGPSKRSVPPSQPGLPRFRDGVIGPGPRSVLGRPGPPTTLTSLGRPPSLAPGAVPELPTVNIPSSATAGGPGPVPPPLLGSTALTGSAADAGRSGRRTPNVEAKDEEERVTLRPGASMPMMVGGVGGRG